jgi:hypothetical protein
MFTILGDKLLLAAPASYVDRQRHSVRLQVADSQGRTWQRLFVIAVVDSEPAATNLYLKSNNLADPYWTKGGTTIGGNYPDPAGTFTAEKITETATRGYHTVLRNIAKPAADRSYRFMVDVKPDGRNIARVQIAAPGYGSAAVLWFDAATGTIPANFAYGSMTIRNAKAVPLPSGWFRFLFDFTASQTVTTLITSIDLATGMDALEYTGNNASGMLCRRQWLHEL